MPAMGVERKLGDTPAFLSLASSPKPTAESCSLNTGHDGQPVMKPKLLLE